MSTITSANSILMLGVEKLFNVPVQIEGFSTDDAFTLADVEMAETMMGVDGKMSAGWIPVIKSLDITLQADSPSNTFFEALVAAETTKREKYKLNGTILISATNRLYVLTSGFIKTGSLMPGAKKTLQPRKFTIDFQDITPAPI